MAIDKIPPVGLDTGAPTWDSSGNLSVSGNFTLTGNASGVIKSGTAVASTSGSNIEFTGIPSTAKRITVMFSGVSTNGSAYIFLQLGTGSTTYTTSGYVTQIMTTGASSMNTAQQTTGFCVINPSTAAGLSGGSLVLTNLSGNIWTGFGSTADTTGTRMYVSSGTITLGAALTAVRVTTTDTFDAGTINVLWE